MGQGRHRKPNNYKRNAAISAVAIGGVAVPLTFAGSANAATVDQWDRIAKCESSGLWNRPDGDGGRSSGGLQFQPPSWNDALKYLSDHGVDISGYPQGPGHQAYKATKEQQMIAGEALLALQGPGAWTCNAKTGYPLGSKSDSMFLGGPKPTSTAAATPSSTPSPSPTPASTPTEYVVVKGDYLVKIAAKLKIEGGWEKLYALNKDVIGSNPNVIEIGMKLRTGATDGLPKVCKSNPSAKPLQADLKRVGYMPNSVASADNYGPVTAGSVVHFHEQHPQFKSVAGPDIQIGPKGWAFLKSMATGSVTTSGIPTSKLNCDGPAPAPTPSPTKGYVMPVQGSIGDNLIIGSNGSMSRSAGGHSGLDIIAPSGRSVVSVAAGTVVSKNSSGAAYGNHVVVKHADGKYTLYAHLSSTSVSVGQSVGAGQQVGTVGSTGNSSGPHLHFEVRTHPTNFSSGIFLDPKAYLRSHGVAI